MFNRKRWRKLNRNEHRYIAHSGKRVRIATIKHKDYKKWKSDKEFDKKLNVWIFKAKNVRIIVSVGDYKHTSFDILMSKVVSKDEYNGKTNEQWINYMCEEAQRKLRKNKQYGMAEMIRNNTNTRGIDAEYTNDNKEEFKFTRFDIRGEDKLKEMTSKRVDTYKKEDKEQKVL